MENRFINSYNNHQVHSAIQNTIELLGQIDTDEDDPIENIIEIRRLDKMINFIKDNIDAIDPEILPINQSVSVFNNINQQIQNVNAHLNRYVSNGTIGELQNANSYIDNAAAQMINLNYIKTKSTAKAIANSTKRYNEKTEELLISQNNIIKDFKEEREELISEIEAVKELNNNLKDIIDEMKEDIEGKYEDYKSEFDEYKELKDGELDGKIKSIRTEYDTLDENLNEKFEEKIESIDENVSEYIESLEEKKNKASEILQIIGNIGVTGDFQNNAINEKKNADYLRVFALIFMVLAVGGAITIIFLAQAKDFDWQYLLLKLLTTTTLTIPATYAAKESSKHRQMERRYRKMQLELATIDPFIDDLPNDKQIELKTELTSKIFGGNILDSIEKEESGDSVPVGNVWKLLENVVKTIANK